MLSVVWCYVFIRSATACELQANAKTIFTLAATKWAWDYDQTDAATKFMLRVRMSWRHIDETTLTTRCIATTTSTTHRGKLDWTLNVGVIELKWHLQRDQHLTRCPPQHMYKPRQACMACSKSMLDHRHLQRRMQVKLPAQNVGVLTLKWYP